MRIVMCEKHPLFPLDHGRVRRLWELAIFLRTRGHDVTILTPGDQAPRVERGISIRTYRDLPWPLRDLAAWIAIRRIESEGPVDILQIENSQLAILGLLARSVGLPHVFEAHVVESRFWAADRSIRGRVLGLILGAGERSLVKRARRVIVFSAADAHAITSIHRIDAERVVTIPLWPGQDRILERPAIPGDRQQVVFLGAYTHAANRDAVEFLTDQIMPRLRAQRPEVELVLVGKGMPIELQDDARGILVISDSPDPDVQLDAALLCLAPIRQGSGVRTKILEYWARGKPVVATEAAAEGLNAKDGENMLIANTADDFVAAISLLLDDPRLRASLSVAGLAELRENFSPMAFSEQVNRAYGADADRGG